MNSLKGNVLVSLAVVIVAVILIVALLPLQKVVTTYEGKYAFEVAIKDPSFQVVGMNSTLWHNSGFTRYEINSTVLSVSVSQNWGFLNRTVATVTTSVPVFTLHNTLSYNVTVNFTKTGLPHYDFYLYTFIKSYVDAPYYWSVLTIIANRKFILSIL